MMSLLKYLLPFILAAAVWGGADVPVDVTEDPALESCIHASVSQTSMSSPDAQLCLPRQVSFANTVRLAGGTVRTISVHRNSLEFAKSGKVINAGIRYSVQNNSVFFHSAKVEPSYKLFFLGRLII